MALYLINHEVQQSHVVSVSLGASDEKERLQILLKSCVPSRNEYFDFLHEKSHFHLICNNLIQVRAAIGTWWDKRRRTVYRSSKVDTTLKVNFKFDVSTNINSQLTLDSWFVISPRYHFCSYKLVPHFQSILFKKILKGRSQDGKNVVLSR